MALLFYFIEQRSEVREKFSAILAVRTKTGIEL
jgi:hypothetical protein